MTKVEQNYLEHTLFDKIPQYIPHVPSPKQALFLVLPHREAFYGGAAGGGKSDALLMGALQYVDFPGYNAILFRRTYQDLSLPDALMDRTHQWLANSDAHWDGKLHRYTFPSNATLTFGYMETARDKWRYQSAQFQSIGIDEVTEWKFPEYTFLFSRLRRLKDVFIPLRMRSASNPIGLGRAWVFNRFVNEDDAPRIAQGIIKRPPFIFADASDNPGIDYDDYMLSLSLLDPVTRKRLRDGDWSAVEAGEKFDKRWFKIVDIYPKKARRVRYWDLASTEAKPGIDPDYTDGCLMSELKGRYTVMDDEHFRGTPLEVEQRIKATSIDDRIQARKDGAQYDIRMEQEPAAAGVIVIDHYAREVLNGFAFKGIRSTGSKEIRSNPLSSAAELRNVDLLIGAWNEEWLAEFQIYPLGEHDDRVDAASGALTYLSGKPRSRGGFMFFY